MCKGSNTSTTTSAPNAQAAQLYQQLLTQAQGVAATPYQAYTGQLTAPVNAQQTTGINDINQNAGFAQPYIQQAAGLVQGASQPITAQQIAQYQNPYTQQVVNSTEAQFNNQNAQQQQQVLGNAAAQGALGGNRVGVAQANLAGQQQLAQAPVIAGLYNQGYQTALSTAQQQQQNQLAAAYGLGNLGISGQGAGLQGAAAQVGAGTLQQQTQQAQDTAAYNQYLQQMAYPFQTTQWLAGLGTGVGSQLGGTSSTQGPTPSTFGQVAGLGLAALSLFNKGGAVKGYADGGSPYAGVGWVPDLSLSTQPFRGPQGANLQQPQMAGPTASQWMSGGKSLKNLGSSFNMSQLGAPDLIGSGEFVGPLGYSPMGEARGGRIAGFADGGAPDNEAPATFDDRFSAVTPQNLYDVASPTAGFGPAPPVLPQGGFATPAPAVTGTEAIPQGVAQNIATPTHGYADNLDHYANVIASMESGNNYAAVGPSTKTGDKAYGKYQVMGQNIPEWTSQVLGQPMTPEQFLANPQAQDAVFKAKFGQYVNQYGPEGAARAWFAGPGGMFNDNAQDVLGTKVADYGSKFMAGVNGQPAQVAGVGADEQLPPGAQAAQFQGQPPQENQGLLSGLLSRAGINITPEARQALMAAGLGMAASRSPYPLQQVGEGGLQGMQTYQQVKNANLAAQKLEQEAKHWQDQLALQTKEYGLKEKQFNLQELQPVKIGQDVIGQPIFAIRDPKTGAYKRIDINTGQPMEPGAASAVTDTGNLALHGEDYLKTIDPTLGSQVRALSEGRMQFPSGFALKSPYWQHMLQAVSQYDPTFDAVQYNARVRARTDATSGKMAQTNNALNTGIGHLDQLTDAVAGLNNVSWSQSANGVKNWLSQEFGGTGVTNFDAIKNRVAPEIVKIWRGTGGAESDIKRDIDSLSASKTPAQLYGAVRQIAHLMQSKIEANRNQYEQAMGAHGIPIQMISPQSQAALDKLEHLANGEAPSTSQKNPADEQALSWANANPNDPRAAAIKQRLGMQ